jgi:hypothetical protein
MLMLGLLFLQALSKGVMLLKRDEAPLWKIRTADIADGFYETR